MSSSDEFYTLIAYTSAGPLRLMDTTHYDTALAAARRAHEVHAAAGGTQRFTRTSGAKPRIAEVYALDVLHISARLKDGVTRARDARLTGYGIDVLTPRGYTTGAALGRAIGRRRGLVGRTNGQIVDRDGQVVCRGWSQVIPLYGGAMRIGGLYHGVEEHLDF